MRSLVSETEEKEANTHYYSKAFLKFIIWYFSFAYTYCAMIHLDIRKLNL